jgi:hypothetical protein
MPEMVAVVKDKAKELAPDSGKSHNSKLNKTIHGSTDQRGLRGVIKALAPHAHLVHEGTKPHITPGKEHVLAIPLNGHLIFRRVTQHPGSRANPFLTNALEQSKDEQMQVISTHGPGALAQAVGV